MYTMILILVAATASPHPIKLTWEVGGFVAYEDCLDTGKLIAKEHLMQGFEVADLVCEPTDD